MEEKGALAMPRLSTRVDAKVGAGAGVRGISQSPKLPSGGAIPLSMGNINANISSSKTQNFTQTIPSISEPHKHQGNKCHATDKLDDNPF
jgi:hypothetical protein